MALGVAIGLVTGLIPGPIQILMAVVIAVPLRANIPAAAFTTLYTNPFTFVPLYILAYNVGQLVTGEHSALVIPPQGDWTWAGLGRFVPELAHWISSLGDTLLIGLAIQCVVFALGGYAFTMLAWRVVVTRAWRTRHARRAAAR